MLLMQRKLMSISSVIINFNFFSHRDVTVPEQIGSYCILLLYSLGGNVKLKSDLVSMLHMATAKRKFGCQNESFFKKTELRILKLLVNE